MLQELEALEESCSVKLYKMVGAAGRHTNGQRTKQSAALHTPPLRKLYKQLLDMWGM